MRIKSAAVLAAISGTVVVGGAHGAILSWNNPAGGTFSTASNWNPAQSPTAADDLTFGIVGNYTVTLDTLEARSLAFRSGVVGWGVSGLAATPFVVGQTVQIGQTSTDVASVTVRIPMNVSGTLTLGRDAGARGTLTMAGGFLSGGRIDLTTATSDLIVGSNGTGTVDLTGTGITLDDDVLIGQQPGSTGTVTLRSTTGTVVLTDFTFMGRIATSGVNGDVLVGNFGTGTANVLQGGRLESVRLVVASQPSSTGTLNVNGFVSIGSTTTRSEVRCDTLEIAHNNFAGVGAGAGTLDLGNNGRATVQTATFVGDPDGGTPALLLRSAAVLTTGDFIDPANVTQYLGGQLSVRGNYLPSTGTAYTINGSGVVELLGTSGRLDATAAPGAPALTFGQNGNMTVRAASGGTIAVPSGQVRAGVTAGHHGEISVKPSSSFTASDVVLGGVGTGRLVVEGGGTATIANCSVAVNSSVVAVGSGALIDIDSLSLEGSGGTDASRVTATAGGRVHVVGISEGTNAVVAMDGELSVFECDTTLELTRSMIQMTGGTLRTPALNLGSAGPNQVGGVIEGLFRVAASSASATITDLTINAPSGFGGSLANSGTIDVQGVLRVNQDANTWFLGNATLGPNSRVESPRAGQISIGRTVLADGVIAAGMSNLGTITCTGDGCDIEGALTSTTGTINGTVLHLAPTGRLNAAGNVVPRVVSDAGSQIVAEGALTLGNGAANAGVDLSGLLIVGSHAVALRSLDAATVHRTTLNGGSIDVRNSSSVARQLILREELSGVGTITASAVLNRNASGQAALKPVGLITINGSYSQLTSGAETAGTLRGQIASESGFDRVAITGTARLGGTLSYNLTPGFDPDRHEAFTILTAPAIVGEFTTLDIPAGWTVEYTPTSVTLIARCAADFNNDGGVDGDDVIGFFERWDASHIAADFNNDGGVDGDDVIGFFERWDSGC